MSEDIALIEEMARSICWTVEKPCDGECAVANRCCGGPAPIYVHCARAAYAVMLDHLKKAPPPA